MRRAQLLLAIVIMLVACDKGHELSSDLSIKDICQLSGDIIKTRMEGQYRVNQEPCVVKSAGDYQIVLSGDYVSPDNTKGEYTARGTLKGRLLLINDIKLHGVHQDFIPFHSFHIPIQEDSRPPAETSR